MAESWAPYEGLDPAQEAALRSRPVRLPPRNPLLEEFAEITKNFRVSFTPETGHPIFRTYLGGAENRLLPLQERRGALRRVPLGDYLTQGPSGFHGGARRDRE